MKHVVLNREFGIVRTVAVFGPGRGGTSLIAGCLRALGVCMGIIPHAYKHEWSPIMRQADGKVDLPQTYQMIQQMNAGYPCWGWKFPSDVFHLETVMPLLRNPGKLVEVLCAFLQIDPGEKERQQAADFIQPLTRGYRPFDAKPDQLHDFSPSKDNLSDSQKLAVDLSARKSQEYSRHFEKLL